LTVRKLDIRPGVSMLAVLRHLNYRPWYALAEFVDNSLESYAMHKSELRRLHGDDFKLCVSIDLDSTSPARITIRDNAAGIFEDEYERAFRPAAVPPNRNGLAEFGMGMKSAACWFAPRWTVRTKALLEPVARTVSFDIESIVDDNIEELSIRETPEALQSHYTEVVLEDLFHVPVGRTVGKLREHLTDIYRAFIRSGDLKLLFRGDALEYSPPKVLKAPFFRDKDGPELEWSKRIEFDFGEGLSVHGFAALRETANTARAGFSLFRRGRVIQGSGDEGYRPADVFGSSNSYRYQRLFGELHLGGFEVSHTKDGFRWDENEQPFLELLRDHLDSDDLPLLKQAEGYRVRVARAQLASAAQTAVENATQDLEANLPAVLLAISDADPVETMTEVAPSIATLAARRFDVCYRDKAWSINVELANDPSESQWLSVADAGEVVQEPRRVDIRVSLAHPFMVRFAQADPEDVEALLRIAAALALAEIVARDSGVRQAGTVRRNVNEILTEALSQP